MAYPSLGSAAKLSTIALAGLLLSGCYQLEIKETLNLDGTSDIAIKMDASAMMNMMTGMAQGMEQAMTQSLDSLNNTPSTFSSCADPQLLEKYKVATLRTPQTSSQTITETNTLTCEPNPDTGTVNIFTTTTYSNQTPPETNNLTRPGSSCDDPIVLATYKTESFASPLVSTTETEVKTTTSCLETDTQIIVSQNLSTGEKKSHTFAKKDLTTAEPLTAGNDLISQNSADSAMADQMQQDLSFCEETDQNPEEIPFVFKSCEDVAPGVGIFHFSKFDTTDLTINNNGTVTYNLSTSTSPVQQQIEQDLNQSDQNPMMQGLDPAAMGFVVEYVLVAPWEILQHSAGVKEGPNTLRLNLLDPTHTNDLQVTLATDGSTLKKIDPAVQNQIDQLVKKLTEKLEASVAPVERKQAYLGHLIIKIKKLSQLRPAHQVPLGYLQTQLGQLAESLNQPVIDEDLLSELEALEQNVWDEVIEPDPLAQTSDSSSEDPNTTQPEATLPADEQPMPDVDDTAAASQAADPVPTEVQEAMSDESLEASSADPTAEPTTAE